MMNLQEAYALPIPEKYKNKPNLYQLARFISSSEHRDEIMTAFPLILPKRTTPAMQNGGDAV